MKKSIAWKEKDWYNYGVKEQIKNVGVQSIQTADNCGNL